MHTFNPTTQRTFVLLDTPPEDGCPIIFSPAEYDDIIAAEAQMIDSSSARSFMQDEFRLSAENMIGEGNFISVFC